MRSDTLRTYVVYPHRLGFHTITDCPVIRKLFTVYVFTAEPGLGIRSFALRSFAQNC